MPYRIVKIGGSSLTDFKDIKTISRLIQQYNQPLVLVVSALNGVTNKLISFLSTPGKGKNDICLFLDALYDRHCRIARYCILDRALLQSYDEKLKQRIEKLKSLLKEALFTSEVPDFLYDEVLSYGERLSSQLLTFILKAYHIHFQEALPEDFGLLTDGSFKNASIDFSKSKPNILKYFDEEKLYLVPGFYGVAEDGKINLLGRGGSDYTAAALALCLNAESLDLWKDVEGFCSADPKIIPHASTIRSLSYQEAAELAYFGSRIIHPRTAEPIKAGNIPARLFSFYTFRGDFSSHTLINGAKKVSDEVIKSISYSDDFGILELRGHGVGLKPGILARVTDCLEKNGINIKSVITSQTDINFLLSENDLENAYNVVKQLNLASIASYSKRTSISVIAAVGEGLVEVPGLAARLFSAAARKQVNIQIIAFGASKVAVYFIVDQKERNLVIHEIHDEFFHSQIKEEVY